LAPAGAPSVIAGRLPGFETLVFGNRLGCTREAKANSFLTHRTGRKLLSSDEGHFVFAAVLLVADEVEAGFRDYFPGREFFLCHNVLERRGTVIIVLKYRVAAQKFETCGGKRPMQIPRLDLAFAQSRSG
jgi:hypothetical protein